MARQLKSPLSEFLISIVLVTLFFQNWLMSILPVFTYTDELVSLAALLYFAGSGRYQRKDLKILGCITLLTVIGLCFNFRYQYQTDFLPLMEDILSVFKFLFIYLGLKAYLLNRGIGIRGILHTMGFVVKLHVLILFICGVLNLLIDIGMSSEVRYGIRDFAFIYKTPGHIINQMTYALFLFAAQENLLQQKTKVWSWMALGIMLLTLKSRAFVLVFLYCALYYFFVIRKKRRIGLEIVLILIFVALIAFENFQFYFLQVGTPRQMFVEGAVRLAKMYFPFGTGFATYGSSAAAEYYSPVYKILGFSNRYGMTAAQPYYLNDTYFPMIIGQFGMIAGVFFLFVLLRYFLSVMKDKKSSDTPLTRVMTYFFVGDVFFSSLPSSYLAHFSVVTLSVFFILFFYRNRGFDCDR